MLDETDRTALARSAIQARLPSGFEIKSWRELAEFFTGTEALYQRGWALAILDQTLARLRQELVNAGKEKLFESLKGALAGDGAQESYALIAKKLDISEQAVKVAVYRLRRRYQELIREDVAQTLANPAELEEEMRYLLRVLSG